MKFGGTSMAGIERIRHVADIVARQAANGDEVLVVVSAMAGETDRLVQFCKEAAATHDPREYDVVVASGEQVTAGLLAMTLQNSGLEARSFMGWQLVKASGVHSNARVEKVESDLLSEALHEGAICVIPGFQGATGEGRLATLGRGGSDTSAVAIAAGVKADRCDIYTDVDGVYTTDPRLTPKARKLDAISFEEMLELAGAGAKVLQVRSVGLAMRENMPLRVVSAFEDVPGTSIVAELGEDMERTAIAGIAADRGEVLVSASDIGIAAAIGALADAGIVADMLSQADGGLRLTVPRAAMVQAIALLEEAGAGSIDTNEDVAKISIVGVGLRSDPQLTARFYAVLADRDIAVHLASSGEIRAAALIDDNAVDVAVRALHTAFGLDS
ncbi:MAG: aspartate kinase [Sphingomonas sp.]|nr:aspartate kinase [Sphingomonas sp.]